MKRKFYSSKVSCPLGCIYCFAKIQNYEKQSYINKENLSDMNFDVIYPSCDSEILFNQELVQLLGKVKNEAVKFTMISLSTKFNLKKNILHKIGLINEELLGLNKGLIKVSVSITNKSMIDVLEPRTSSYSERLELLNEIAFHNIPCSVNLKPILPFIDNSEYYEIIDETSRFTKYFLTGGLYLSPNSEFYKIYIKGKFSTMKRVVNWLDSAPSWDYIEMPSKIDNISKYAGQKGLYIFQNDAHLLEALHKKYTSVCL